jgi:outer membrane protein
MNRFSVVCSLAFGLVSATFGQSAMAPSKVGIINIQSAIIGTSEGQAAAKALDERSAPKKRELEKLQAEIQGLRDKLNKMGSIASEDEKRKLMQEIDSRTKSFNRQVEDAQSELDQEQGKVLNELGGKLLAVLDKYAKDNGYAVILDVSAQNTPVLFAANQVDVTQEIVALYNKNVAAPTSAAPAPATGSLPAATRPAPTPAPIKPVAPKPAGAK